MFLKKKKNQQTKQNKTTEWQMQKKKFTAWFCLFAIDGARLKVMLMKGIITFISNSNHKIQVNLLGYLYGTLWLILALSIKVAMKRLQTSSPLYYVSPSCMWDQQTKKVCTYVMNETTFPPKGKLPQFSTPRASYQIISWLKQRAEHKSFFFNFNNFNGTDSSGNSTSWKKLLNNKLVSHR